MSPRSRGLVGFAVMAGTMLTTYALGAYLQFFFRGGYTREDAGDSTFPHIDVTSMEYFFPLVVYIGYGISDSLFQCYITWVLTTLAGTDTNKTAQFFGFYKGVQSLFAAVAWILDSEYVLMSYKYQYFVCVAMFVFGCLLALPVVMELSDDDEERGVSSYEIVKGGGMGSAGLASSFRGSSFRGGSMSSLRGIRQYSGSRNNSSSQISASIHSGASQISASIHSGTSPAFV